MIVFSQRIAVRGVLREVAGTLCRNQDQRAAPIGHQAALRERTGDHPRVPYMLDSDQLLIGSDDDFPTGVKLITLQIPSLSYAVPRPSLLPLVTL